MDVRIINSFLAAAIHVLKTMARIEAKPGKPFLKKDDSVFGDVSAIIDITGAVHGFMTLSFDENCIKAIVSNLFGESVTVINDEVKDAVGELTNVICGDARRRIALEKIILVGGIPSIVAGKDHPATRSGKGPRIAIPFTTPAGHFAVEISLQDT